MLGFRRSGHISYSMIALYIGDHEGFELSGQKYHPSQYLHGALAVLVRYNQAQSVFSATQNASNKLLRNSNLFYSVEVSAD